MFGQQRERRNERCVLESRARLILIDLYLCIERKLQCMGLTRAGIGHFATSVANLVEEVSCVDTSDRE